MDYVTERLTTKNNIKFGATQDSPNNIQLEIMAETVYINVSITIVVTVKSIFCFISIITLACDHFSIVSASYV